MKFARKVKRRLWRFIKPPTQDIAASPFQSFPAAEANAKYIEEYIGDKWLEIPATDDPPFDHAGAIIHAMENRGYELVQQGDSKIFFHDEACVGGIWGVTTGTNTIVGFKIAQSKQLTKTVLERAGLPVSPGQSFQSKDREAALAFVHSQPETIFVIKPDDGLGGRGITTGVNSWNFEAAWKFAASSSKTKRIVIEQEVAGIDVRVFVIAGTVHAAAVRIPPFIRGNGVDTVATLIDQLTEARLRNGYLRSKKVDIDEAYLKHQGIDFNTVLKPAEIRYLNSAANMSRGGISVDVTDTIAPEAKKLAIRVVDAIPGMTAGGVDFLMPSIASIDSVVVTEVNTGASTKIHMDPTFGTPRFLGDALADEILRVHTS